MTRAFAFSRTSVKDAVPIKSIGTQEQWALKGGATPELHVAPGFSPARSDASSDAALKGGATRVRKPGLLLASLLAILALGLAACGGSNNGTSISVSISPASATVPVGLTVQFAGTVNGSNNPVVNWQVNSVAGGNSTVGTISTTGLYTAPAAIPNPAAVTVSAVAAASKSAVASSTVTIVAAQNITVTPTAPTIPAGGQQQFTANVVGQSNPQIQWQVNSTVGGNSTVGTISTSGLYTAPLSPPAGGVVTITAVGQGGLVGSGSTTATIQYANATLAGSYAFLVSGSDVNGLYALAGSFTADGAGHITGGQADLNEAAGVFTQLPIVNTSTYAIGADGRGSIALNISTVIFTLNVAMVSNQHGFTTEFDTTATSSGTIDLQDPTAFSAAAITGNYVFNLSGIDNAGAPLVVGGVFNASGSALTGVLDANDNLSGNSFANLVLSGNYTVAATGRGTATFTTSGTGTLSYSFYVVNKNDLKFIELDTAVLTSGETFSLAPGTISNATLNGSFPFTLAGASAAGAFTVGGIFTTDGNGNITGGIEDFNNNGSFTASQTTGGTYTMASNGRGTAKIQTPSLTLNLAIYPASNGTIQMVELDTNALTSGAALTQATGTTFSNSTFSGAYAINYTAATLAGEQDATGQIRSNGSGTLSGLLDLNNTGALQPSLAITGTNAAVAASGRGTATVQIGSVGTLNLVFYFASGTNAVFINSDHSPILVGTIQKQF
jgi:hypothetical protein